MAYSPQIGLVYIPAIEMEMTMSDGFARPEDWQRPAFLANNGADGFEIAANGPKPSSALVAMNPLTNAVAWRVPTPTAVAACLRLRASWYSRARWTTVSPLTRRRTANHYGLSMPGAPVIAPPIAYTVNGREYVTVLSGSGGSLVLIGDPFKYHPVGYREQARRVLTFAIGGRGRLPAPKPFVLQPVSDPVYVADRTRQMRG